MGSEAKPTRFSDPGTPRTLGDRERQLAMAAGPGWCVQLIEIDLVRGGVHWEVCVRDETGDEGEFALDSAVAGIEWYEAEVTKRCRRWLDEA